MSSKRVIRSSTNQFSGDSLDYVEGRFRYTKNSYSCTALILILFRFPSIGGLMAFSAYSDHINISLVHYFVSSAFIMLPLMYMFLFIGHYSKLGCLVLGRIIPASHGVGYTMIVITTIQAMIDLAIACDALIFLKESLSPKIAFMECKDDWGKDCIGLKEMQTCKQLEHPNASLCNFTSIDQLSAYQYRTYVLREINPKLRGKRGQIDHFWKKIEGTRVIYLSICAVILLITNDLDAGGNNKFTTIAVCMLIIGMLLICFACSLYLPNADGLFDIYTINISSLTDTDVWFETLLYFMKAINVVNVSTVLAGSYMPYFAMSDLQAFVTWIGVMFLYFLGEIMSSLMRPLLAMKLGTKPEKMFVGGSDAVLVLYPQLLGSFHSCPQAIVGSFIFVLLALCFYRLKIFLAAIYHTVADGKPVIRVYRFYIRIFSCFLLIVLTFPICVVGLFRRYLITLMILEDILTTLVLIITSFSILYIYGVQTLFDDHHFTYGSQPAIFFKITLLIIPVALIGFGATMFIRLSNLYIHKPIIALYVFVLLPFCLSLQLIGLLYIAYYYLKRQNMAHLLRCEDNWGDPNPLVRKQRIIYHPRKETNYFRRIGVCKHNCLRHNRLHYVIVKDEDNIHNDSYRRLHLTKKIYTEKELGIEGKKHDNSYNFTFPD